VSTESDEGEERVLSETRLLSVLRRSDEIQLSTNFLFSAGASRHDVDAEAKL
jgi:hypothetical protein